MITEVMKIRFVKENQAIIDFLSLLQPVIALNVYPKAENGLKFHFE